MLKIKQQDFFEQFFDSKNDSKIRTIKYVSYQLDSWKILDLGKKATNLFYSNQKGKIESFKKCRLFGSTANPMIRINFIELGWFLNVYKEIH